MVLPRDLGGVPWERTTRGYAAISTERQSSAGRVGMCVLWGDDNEI